ncbi:chromate transporter [Rhizobium sp. Root73]|uniref:chromate transporter n=1 Tax=unclassified Rhizobium TaxID=2613769 RepID=UPI000727D456|nr:MULTISPECIES: chromate transporter [unclassified Rhizobium]KQY16428.1 chromate transporter [Rhizobium sp. Root1334]KRC12801.1 chromate transporter [Rhizobium sp. Root73]
MRDDPLLGLVMVFVPFSLISIGGGASIIAGMENQVVTARGWLNAQQFLELFAISRAAPGPGVMLATLVGWKLAGWLGAIVASLALFVPSSLLCYTVFRVSNAHRDKRWHRAMREGLAPVGTGLIIAGVISIFGLMGTWQAGTIAVAAAGVLSFLPRVPTLVIISIGGMASLMIYNF